MGGRRVMGGWPPFRSRGVLVAYEHTRYSFGSSWTNTVRARFPSLSLFPLRSRCRPRHRLLPLIPFPFPSASVSSSGSCARPLSSLRVALATPAPLLSALGHSSRLPRVATPPVLPMLLMFSVLYEPQGRTGGVKGRRIALAQVETRGIVNFYPLPAFFLHSEIRRSFTNDFRGNSAPVWWVFESNPLDPRPEASTAKCTSRGITPEIARLL